MDNYPEAVKKIVDDYLQRVKRQLRLLPGAEQEDFVLEIQSHVYDAYQEPPGRSETAPTDEDQDEVGRILAVLRRLGEPAEVVADRLPTAIMRSGRKRSAPAYVIAGILIALFGIPLGFGGAAVVVGILVAMAGLVACLYAAAFTTLLAAALLFALGLTRMYEPDMWDKLLGAGVIQMDAQAASVLAQVPAAVQGYAMIIMACVFALVSLALLWVGRRYVRGVGFLFNLVFDKARQLSRRARRIAGGSSPSPSSAMFRAPTVRPG